MKIYETGTVVRIEDGKAAVRIRSEPSEACGGCKACHARSGGEFLLWLDADDLKEGDQVTVEVPVPSPWRAIRLVFALPLVGLVGGVMAGSEWTGFQETTGLGPETGAVVLGVACVLAALVPALLAERRFSRRYRPRVIEARGPR